MTAHELHVLATKANVWRHLELASNGLVPGGFCVTLAWKGLETCALAGFSWKGAAMTRLASMLGLSDDVCAGVLARVSLAWGLIGGVLLLLSSAVFFRWFVGPSRSAFLVHVAREESARSFASWLDSSCSVSVLFTSFLNRHSATLL